ncbi:MAG: fibronectin type III domain-containing protein, partial [Myxococcota bacterium]
NMAQMDTVWFRNCTFTNNRVNDDSQTQSNPKNSSGGAMALDHGMNVVIINSVFNNNEVKKDNNSSRAVGGALAIEADWSSFIYPVVIIKNSRFTKNKVTLNVQNGNAYGGAIFAGSPIDIINTLIDSNSVEFNANNGGARGGGLAIGVQMYTDGGQNQIYGYSYLINNTIADNYAGASNNGAEAGGIFIEKPEQQRGTWFNNIIWGNRSNNSSDDRHNLNWVDDNQFELVTDYNNVEYSEHYSYFMGDNSYDMDPVFYSATNYQLATGSPLIGAGKSSYNGSSAPKKDILGNDRPNPTGSNPDLGPYEHALVESPYPKQVQNLVVQAGSREATLSWDVNPETDIAKYLVYKSETKGFMPVSSDSVGETTSTSYTVTGLDNRKEYHFTVAAVNNSGYRGTFANQVSAIPQYNGPNWYVAVDGSNANDGDADAPMKDLNTAIDSAKTGHTVILLAGSHSGPENREIMLDDGMAIRIIGDPNSDVEDVVLDAGNSGRHFNIFGDYDSTMVFKNITFRGGSGQGDGGSWLLAGSIRIEGGSYWDEQNQQQVEGYPSPKFIGCVWEDN